MCRLSYGALTCESCRVFFGRNVNRIQGFFHTNEEREQMVKYSDQNQTINNEITTISKTSTPSGINWVLDMISDPVVRPTSEANTIPEIIRDSKSAVKMDLDVLKLGKLSIYDGQRNFMFKLNQEYNHDTNLMDLLTVIVLFNPNRPDLRHRDIINLQRQTYIYLLQRI
ncbi:unnamed protein product [Medioppia subpectinata]|uniref:Nuclear receptor domain-containing protein n=1 Tax=Medioppia subpectinata TaxID=1979941 RepID=A0A7R9PXI3_9ACAR|nr:unnamed protein product [Medioppia subpectinata]CAG2104834.1 unnamed protein product [Medioppia subpectinata]